VILVSAFFLVNKAMKDVITSTENRRPVHGFIATLSKTLDEMRESNRRQADIQFMASVSPTAGLLVKDLWTSHTSKRAWAVRGANLQCKNGEILAILGDDGAGKTRMLTSISESLISPPKRSRTSNKVRGYVAVSGVEGSKWDQTLLKRRLGILLSDVRTVADTASLYSGWTLEEILEPVDGLRTLDTSHKLSSSEKSSIILALKVRIRPTEYGTLFLLV
jgi:ABC-type protease/lipase transport system fused ATPase/permease subunit